MIYKMAIYGNGHLSAKENKYEEKTRSSLNELLVPNFKYVKFYQLFLLEHDDYLIIVPLSKSTVAKHYLRTGQQIDFESASFASK